MDEVEIIKGNVKEPLFFANNNTISNSCMLLQRYDYIPLDYVKCEIIGISKEHFKQFKNLIFTYVFDKNTKDVIKYEYCEYKNLKIKVYDNRIEFSGSLHKYYNSGIHNYNDFNINSFNDVLNDLKSDFGLLPENLWINQLEYGVSINPVVKSDLIINNLLLHKKCDFENVINSRFGNYKQVKHNKYILKIYNKSKQYKQVDEILRIEIKQTNWSEYRINHNISTLKDFIESDKSIFIHNLIKKWIDVLFYNPLNTINDKWNKYSNVNFWRELRLKSNTTFSKHYNRLKDLNKKSTIDIQKDIKNQIIEKVNFLQGVTNSDFNTNFNIYNNSQVKRTCLLTGFDISIQKENSFLLSHSGLKFLYQYNLIEFEKLKRIFLSDKWINSDVNQQIKEIAHNIRNRYNHKVKTSNVSQLTIFI